MSDKTIPRLITFPPSCDCEVSRWVLRHYGITYTEEPHAPPFFVLAVGLRGGKKIPLYSTDEMLINGARPLIDYFEHVVAPSGKLIPQGYESEVEAAWQAYNVTLGTALVTWAYTQLLPHKAIMIRPLSLNTPCLEEMTVRHCYWLPKLFLWKALHLGEDAAAKALGIIRQVFAEVDGKLADGRRYLVGNRLTLADIAFAVAGAPLVVAEGYGGQGSAPGPLPAFEEMPAAAQAVAQELRATAAGQFVLRLYREERYRDVATAQRP